ncbi:hypothetical protein Taro_005257 [Colocasia esculenta]|uniref:Ripening-related protein n=1 Tax=Colocasia esculenta TaxID=4460 RepID=A0A843TPH8_COLES|nr:hypothetical protein [Colocasia esculenta]
MEAITSKTKYECLLFDMDDTLYPLSSGINLACRKNIQDYMLHHLHIEESLVPKMCLDLYKEHGTTMAGLKALGYEFDNDEFHACVHGSLPYEKLKPDPLLRNLLLSMPQRKIIFTNADKAHVAKVLSKLGLEDCFEGVICFETLNPPLPTGGNKEDSIDTSSVDSVKSNDAEGDDSFSESELKIDVKPSRHSRKILCKPNVEAMEAACQLANIDPKRSIFFDDSARNIASGKAVGLHTVIVGSSVLVPGADFALESIHNIKEARIPEIWEDVEQLESVVPSGAVEAVVLA